MRRAVSPGTGRCYSLMMRLELSEHLIAKRGLADEWKKLRR